MNRHKVDWLPRTLGVVVERLTDNGYGVSFGVIKYSRIDCHEVCTIL